MNSPHTCNRRQWLQLAGTAALGAGTLAATGDSGLRAKAKKNLKLAIFTGVYASLPVAEAARRIREDGFSGVVLEPAFADAKFDPWAPDWDVLKKITDALAAQALKVVGLYGYYNVVDPDARRRQRGEARMQLLIENWRRFGSPVIATETGTFNAKSEWVEAPENLTEAAFLECSSAFERWAGLAEKNGAIVAIEPYWRNVIHSVSRAEQLFGEIKSPGLKLIMDPCNYFTKADLSRMQPLLQDLFKRVGPQTVLAHAKDVKESADGTDLPAAGRGVLDYPLYLRLLARLNRELYLALEHLPLEDVPRARDFVLSQFAKI